MVYTLRFFLFLFHNSNIFGSCITHIYMQDVLKLKKKSGAKRLINRFYGFLLYFSRNKLQNRSHIPHVNEGESNNGQNVTHIHAY